MESHLAECAVCRGLAVQGGREPRPAPLLPRLAAAAAAAVLLAAGAALLFPGLRPGGGDLESRLVAAASALASRHPGVLGDLRPLDAAERLRRGETTRAGGLRALLPCGNILEDRPPFSWSGPPADAAVRVAVEAPGGAGLWSASGTGGRKDYPLDAPPLLAGTTCTWSVSWASPLGPEEDRRSFTVLAEADRRALAEAMAKIEAEAPPELIDLLKAHLALRRGLVAEAERWARRAAARSGDRVVRQTLFQALERQGSPEAKTALGPGDGEEGR
jgi:hypothetical protein